MSLWTIFLHASLVNKLLLVVLLGASVLSWAIVIDRFRYFRATRRGDEAFLSSIGRSWTRKALHSAATSHPLSPVGRIFLAAEAEVMARGNPTVKAWTELLEIERDAQRPEGEKGLPILAIIASASPFIGLLGTVWGVMIAFLRLAELEGGQPALEMVGPGIAEALIATAVGLFAAIPAVIAYNAFVAQQRNLQRRVNDFIRRLKVAIAIPPKSEADDTPDAGEADV